MPFAPRIQAPGDLVPSKDWNEAMAEITRLEKDKVNRAGDTVRGNFAVSGELGAANLFGGARFRAAVGTSAIDGSDWVNYGTTGIYVDVSTTKGAFTTTPYYFASLHGDSWHWNTTGGTSIYSPTKTGFRIYLRWSDGAALDKTRAQSGKWHVQWLGVQVEEMVMATAMVFMPMFIVNP
jgi:hypothetical protein